MSANRPRIGELLVSRGVVDNDVVQEALALQKETGLRLASQIWSLSQADERALLTVLTEQLGAPGCVIGSTSVALDTIQKLPAVMANERKVLPIGAQDGRLLVAAADPFDERLAGEMKLISQGNVAVYVALQAAIAKAAAQAYALKPTPEVTHFLGWDANPRMPGFRDLITPQAPPPEEEVVDIPELGDGLLESINEQVFVQATDNPIAATRPLVLVVDDDTALAEMIQLALERLDLDVITCNDGRDAAKQLRTIQPRVIVLDVMLPGVHGFELARMIRGSERFAGTRLIMMSGAYKGWRIKEDVRESFQADAFFEKPFELIPLREKVQELLGESDESPAEPSKLALQAFQQALELHNAGQLEQAEARLQEVLTKDPFFVKAYLLLAVVRTKLKRPFLAADTLEMAIDLDPGNFKALASLARIYEQTGFRHKAAGTWERALFAAPDDTSKETVRQRLNKLLS